MFFGSSSFRMVEIDIREKEPQLASKMEILRLRSSSRKCEVTAAGR